MNEVITIKNRKLRNGGREMCNDKIKRIARHTKHLRGGGKG